MKQSSGRIVGVFGIPCSGKSTILKMIINSSKEILAHISSGDIARKLSQEAELQHMAAGNLFPHEDKLRAEILNLIEKRRAAGSEIVFLDGFPRTGDQIRWMLENQLAGFDAGCLIKIHCEPIEAIKRAGERYRDSQDEAILIRKKIETQYKLIDEMESWIFRLCIPYYTVVNLSLTAAVEQMVRYIGLKK